MIRTEDLRCSRIQLVIRLTGCARSAQRSNAELAQKLKIALNREPYAVKGERL